MIVSLVIGITLAATATTVFHRLEDFRAIAVGAGLLTLGICGLHFTAMGAAFIEPDPTIAVDGFSADASTLALAIAGLTVLVMVAGLAAAVIDRQTSQNSIERIRELVDAASEGIVIAADGVMINVNRRVAELCGYQAEDLIGKRVGGGLLEEMVIAPKSRFQNRRSHAEDGPWQAASPSRSFANRSGRVCAAMRSTPSATSPNGIATKRKSPTWRTTMRSPICPIASCWPSACSRRSSRRQGREQMAVLCLDLDRFKEVNDALGHTVGDTLLKAVAGRLRSCVREGDTIARMGGDEFVILQCAAAQPLDATSLATRIVEALSAPFVVQEHQMVVGASVGIALSPHDGTEPEQLLKNADIALYRAKSEGRGTYRFFEKGMDVRMQARRALEMDFRKALVEGEFELHYQPIQELAKAMRFAGSRHSCAGTTHSAERCRPRRSSRWPRRRASLCRSASGCCARPARKRPNGPVISRSRSTFRRSSSRAAILSRPIVNAIVAAGLSPSRLELEITETVLLHDSAATLETLRKLQNFGVRIALDDFGTGYSSSELPAQLPVRQDQDRSLIHQRSVRRQRGGSSNCPRHDANGPEPGHVDDGRRSGDHRTARHRPSRRVHRSARLPVQPAEGRRTRSQR